MRDTPAKTMTFDVEIETIKCEPTSSHTDGNAYVPQLKYLAESIVIFGLWFTDIKRRMLLTTKSTDWSL